jgi:hypothetical protein
MKTKLFLAVLFILEIGCNGQNNNKSSADGNTVFCIDNIIGIIKPDKILFYSNIDFIEEKIIPWRIIPELTFNLPQDADKVIPSYDGFIIIKGDKADCYDINNGSKFELKFTYIFNDKAIVEGIIKWGRRNEISVINGNKLDVYKCDSCGRNKNYNQYVSTQTYGLKMLSTVDIPLNGNVFFLNANDRMGIIKDNKFDYFGQTYTDFSSPLEVPSTAKSVISIGFQPLAQRGFGIVYENKIDFYWWDKTINEWKFAPEKTFNIP